MLKAIRDLLQRVIKDIDSGNSNIDESECIEIIDSLKRLTDRQRRLSKYEACKYLRMSRATFDNYVRKGVIPRGLKEPGFKELSWDRKTLDDSIIRIAKHTIDTF